MKGYAREVDWDARVKRRQQEDLGVEDEQQPQVRRVAACEVAAGSDGFHGVFLSAFGSQCLVPRGAPCDIGLGVFVRGRQGKAWCGASLRCASIFVLRRGVVVCGAFAVFCRAWY